MGCLLISRILRRECHIIRMWVGIRTIVNWIHRQDGRDWDRSLRTSRNHWLRQQCHHNIWRWRWRICRRNTKECCHPISIELILYLYYNIIQTELILPPYLVWGISFKYSSNLPSFFNVSKSFKYSYNTLNFKSNGLVGSYTGSSSITSTICIHIILYLSSSLLKWSILFDSPDCNCSFREELSESSHPLLSNQYSLILQQLQYI